MAEAAVERMDAAFDKSRECPIVYAMNILSSKWMMPIIWHLLVDGDMSYNQIARTVKGISNTVLTRCLRGLAAEDMVIKREEDGRVLYTLSDAGRALLPTLQCLFDWGAARMEEDEDRRDDGPL